MGHCRLESPLHFTAEEESRFSCDMTTFQSASSVRETQMCVHSFQDSVSDEIRHNKHWYDCDVLPSLWNEVGYIGSGEESSYYVDIGSNIGSCVIEMLLATDAKIIAFEPHPMNLFNLKKTIASMGKSFQDRVVLFPVGLGSMQSTSTIFSATGNMGNSGTLICYVCKLRRLFVVCKNHTGSLLLSLRQ